METPKIPKKALRLAREAHLLHSVERHPSVSTITKSTTRFFFFKCRMNRTPYSSSVLVVDVDEKHLSRYRRCVRTVACNFKPSSSRRAACVWRNTPEQGESRRPKPQITPFYLLLNNKPAQQKWETHASNEKAKWLGNLKLEQGNNKGYKNQFFEVYFTPSMPSPPPPSPPARPFGLLSPDGKINKRLPSRNTGAPLAPPTPLGRPSNF